ncbi:XRE family transcriptional regulator [Pseudomonas sp. RC10]|uniref:LexA family protein n=1 Tax=Pseudomonas bambusae TaxID=3139142 RepID=UPI00313976D4
MTDWIKAVRDAMARLDITQEKLAERMGKTQGAVGHWLNGRREPGLTDINQMLDIVGLPPLAISPGLEDGSNLGPALQPIREPRDYPLISWVEAGEVTEAPSRIGGTHAWIESTENAGYEAYWLTVKGHSMTSNGNPSFPEGSLILVKPDSEIINGKYYVVEMLDTGKKTFKQYVEDAGYRYLRPLNDTYRTIEIDHNCRFLGRVVDTKMTGL